MKRRWVAGCLAVLLTASVIMSGCGKDSGVEGSRSAVFKVGKERCSTAEAKILLLNYQNQYRDVFGVDLWQATGENNQELVDYIKDLTVSQMAEIYLLSHMGVNQDMELTQEEQSHVEAAAAAYYNSLTDREREYTGANEKDVQSFYEHYAMAQKVFYTLTQSVNQEVSDDDARVMSVMQLYTTDQTKANTAYAQIRGGKDFAAVAASYGEGTSLHLRVDRSDIPDTIEEQVFSLSKGEYTPVLELAAGNEAEDGYVIYYCENNFEEELTQENKPMILQQRMSEAVSKTYNTYKSSTDSKLYGDAWNDVRIETGEGIQNTSLFEVFEEYCGEDY